MNLKLPLASTSVWPYLPASMEGSNKYKSAPLRPASNIISQSFAIVF